MKKTKEKAREGRFWMEQHAGKLREVAQLEHRIKDLEQSLLLEKTHRKEIYHEKEALAVKLEAARRDAKFEADKLRAGLQGAIRQIERLKEQIAYLRGQQRFRRVVVLDDGEDE